MRWPFGPPHLTLKPSKKNKKQKKKKKNTQKTTEQKKQHPTTKQNKANKQKQNQHQRENKKQETQKHPNLPNTKQQEEATPEKPQKLGKKACLTLLELLQTHKKQTTITLKPQKTNPQKHLFAVFKKNPLFFINFLFFHHTIFVFEKLGFAENTIKIVFSEKHSFSRTQLVKPTFSPMSKKHLFPEKMSFWVLANFR